MKEELIRIQSSIDRKSYQTQVFFRDDDAGWSDHRLQDLGDLTYSLRIPLDLAVIPSEINPSTCDVINGLRSKQESSFQIHQHGYSHINHELDGRKCEFGLSRSYEDQYKDIAAGRNRLIAAFGDSVEPIFTPPWNRCTHDTVAALRKLGIRVLSRINGSTSLIFDEMVCPLDVHVDWFKRRKGQRLNWPDFCTYASKQFSKYDTVGIMLHHQEMDNVELERFTEFVMMLKESPKISFNSMLSYCNPHFVL